MSEQTFPLAFLTTGQKAVVKEIASGRNLRHRLNELGFVRGTEVQVIRNDGCGPLIVSLGNGLGNSRLAIGRGATHKVMVEWVKET